MKKCFILFFILSFSSYARINCPSAVIENIQIEGAAVLYKQVGYPWRRLGILNEDGTRERLSAMLAAQMAGKLVQVSYRRLDYDCKVTNYGESAYIVKTYN